MSEETQIALAKINRLREFLSGNPEVASKGEFWLDGELYHWDDDKGWITPYDKQGD